MKAIPGTGTPGFPGPIDGHLRSLGYRGGWEACNIVALAVKDLGKRVDRCLSPQKTRCSKEESTSAPGRRNVPGHPQESAVGRNVPGQI